jgi:hypothetical protein
VVGTMSVGRRLLLASERGSSRVGGFACGAVLPCRFGGGRFRSRMCAAAGRAGTWLSGSQAPESGLDGRIPRSPWLRTAARARRRSSLNGVAGGPGASDRDDPARPRSKPRPTLPQTAYLLLEEGACLAPSRGSTASAPAKRCE